MIPTSSLGSAPIDPTAFRAIEQISHVINDIEQRLQIVRVALAQSVPTVPGAPFGVSSPFGVNVPNPWSLLQNPSLNPLAMQQLMAISQLTSPLGYGVPSGLPVTTPFGLNTGFGTPGVSAPFGVHPGFLAPTTPFRF